MSRVADLALADQQIAAKQAELQKIQKDYITYHDEVSNEIKGILVEAGVYDEVHDMETDRLAVQQKAQAKANAIQADIAKIQAGKDFLLSLGSDIADQSTDPQTSVIMVPDTTDAIEVDDTTESQSPVVNIKAVPARKKPSAPAF